ncbi:hypothetical protein [uncultured Chitinophaga sp.]|uniref:hypothetical protein n=1 Tax=uncultured Chitinophaga sp. TaxID=339340 RepID=UPI0025CF47AE|nr:hypothetical protein [uncultured Chitinophaga sp.]
MNRLLLLPLLLLAMLFSSCKKEEVVITNRTILQTIRPVDWKYDNATLTYYAVIDHPAIDQYTVDNNGIIVAISSDDAIWEAIPDVYNGYAYTYTYQTGSLVLEVQGATGSTVNPPASNILVKIVIVESR